MNSKTILSHKQTKSPFWKFWNSLIITLFWNVEKSLFKKYFTNSYNSTAPQLGACAEAAKWWHSSVMTLDLWLTEPKSPSKGKYNVHYTVLCNGISKNWTSKFCFHIIDFHAVWFNRKVTSCKSFESLFSQL